MIKFLNFMTDILLKALITQYFDIIIQSENEATNTYITGQLGLKKPATIGRRRKIIR